VRASSPAYQAPPALGTPAPNDCGAGYYGELTRLFAKVDMILAPATRSPAFPIGQAWMELGDNRLPAAGHLGVFTQSLSFAGLPTVAKSGALPLRAQLVAAPWREDLALGVAAGTEALGAVASPSPVPTEAHAR
jgi:1-carboxybiuret hydrolase